MGKVNRLRCVHLASPLGGYCEYWCTAGQHLVWLRAVPYCEHTRCRHAPHDQLPVPDHGIYIAALYFSVKTTSSIGMLDIVPTTFIEKVYNIVHIWVGTLR
jgi:hypothetical protein